MKIILIAWFVIGGNAGGASVTAEVDSMQACQEAGGLLFEKGLKAKGKNVDWNFICVPKGVERPE